MYHTKALWISVLTISKILINELEDTQDKGDDRTIEEASVYSSDGEVFEYKRK